MNWDDIIGHSRQLRVLRAAVASERTAHAYLFLGEAGVGKSEVARVVAYALLCAADDAAKRPCGHCRSCQTPLADHPDYIGVKRTGATIGIDHVRHLQRALVFRPAWHRRKVVTLEQAETITVQGQNALLKLIEEPPPYATFLLMASHSHTVLPTVRSRCIQFRFGRVPTALIQQALVAKGMDGDKAQLAATLAFGRPTAVNPDQIETMLQRRQVAFQWLQQLLHGRAAVWQVGNSWEAMKDEATNYLDMLVLLMRDVLLCATDRSELAVNQDIIADVGQIAAQTSVAGCVQALHALIKLKEAWHDNANFRIALDATLIYVQRGLRSA